MIRDLRSELARVYPELVPQTGYKCPKCGRKGTCNVGHCHNTPDVSDIEDTFLRAETRDEKE
jgi:hypothetical protein